MSTDPSDALRILWQQEAGKFDYFVLGVTIALVGYLAEGMTLQPLTFVNSDTVEVGAVVALLLAAFFGFVRLDTSIEALRANAHHIQLGARAEKLRSAAMEVAPTDYLTIPAIGAVLMASDLLEVADGAQNQSEHALEISRSLGERMRWWYWLRNVSLLAAFLGLIAARVMEAYEL